MEDTDFDVLPVVEFKDELVAAIRNNQIIICVGETGSGKTTQIPQFCADAHLGNGKAIAVTQPRRVAAITVAHRVASERQCTIGREVGYTVRFDDCTREDTLIHFMTDGILVRECMHDPILSKYGVVMLDEAHERSIHTDILFGLVKHAVSRRPDLKVVVTSATLDIKKFSHYFNHCPIVEVPGRLFPVDIYHSKMKQVMTTSGPSSNAYIQAAVDTALKIHATQESGHILVFLTGQDEIEKACQLLRSTPVDSELKLSVLPLYAAMPAVEQKKVFQVVPDNVRKCVVCTNIAETSVTVPHVRYVVDPGFVKQKAYDPTRRIESLIVVPISQVSAQQRAGRAGRTGPGQCYRLYSSDSYRELLPETIPEIKRSNLSNVVLYLKALGVDDILGFDFMDPPTQEQLLDALVLLHMLQALDDDGKISTLGRQMSNFPLEPTVSRMLIESTRYNCTISAISLFCRTRVNCFDDMLTIAAMLSVENIYYYPPAPNRKRRYDASSVQDAVDDRLADAEAAHARLRVSRGDHFTLLNVYNHWRRCGETHSWCEEYYIRYRALKMAKNIREQLLTDATKSGLSASSRVSSQDEIDHAIVEAILSGLFMNAAKRCANDSAYRSMLLQSKEDVKLFHFHPSSVYSEDTSRRPPEYELVFSGKALMKNVVKVKHDALTTRRSQWVMIHPYVLSNRKDLLVQDAALLQKNEEKIENSNSVQTSTADKVKGKETSREEVISAAKLRYLQRKKGLA